eukprot:1080543-Amphidinium_carterae.2
MMCTTLAFIPIPMTKLTGLMERCSTPQRTSSCMSQAPLAGKAPADQSPKPGSHLLSRASATLESRVLRPLAERTGAHWRHAGYYRAAPQVEA